MTIFTAAAVFLLAAASVSADTAPQPAVSGGVKPVSASAGSSTQPNSTVSVSSGRATGTADGNGADGTSCGAQAGAAGGRYGVQPVKAGSAGTSSPQGCASGGSGAGAQAAGSTANSTLAANSANGNAGKAPGTLSTLGLDRVANTADAVRGGLWFWVLLAVLAGIVLFLLGVAVAPKRQRTGTAA